MRVGSAGQQRRLTAAKTPNTGPIVQYDSFTTIYASLFAPPLPSLALSCWPRRFQCRQATRINTLIAY
jgi:hypothetical protein